MEPDDIERQFREAAQRTRRHWYEDGLAELLIGGVFAVLAVYFLTEQLLGARLARNRAASVAVNLLFPVTVVAACLLANRLIRRAKETYVYPRTGFVRYARRPQRRWLAGFLGGGVAGMTAALIRTAPGIESWIPAIEGFLVGAALFWQARFAGVPRLSTLGGIAVLVGLGVSLLGLPSNASAAAFFGAVGVALLVAGATAFTRFRRQAPPAEEP